MPEKPKSVKRMVPPPLLMILTSIHPIESYLYELKQSLHLVKIPMLLSFPSDSNKIIVIAQFPDCDYDAEKLIIVMMDGITVDIV